MTQSLKGRRFEYDPPEEGFPRMRKKFVAIRSCTKGLIITPSDFTVEGEPITRMGWRITHERSGMSVMKSDVNWRRGFSLKTARLLAGVWGSTGIDFMAEPKAIVDAVNSPLLKWFKQWMEAVEKGTRNGVPI